MNDKTCPNCKTMMIEVNPKEWYGAKYHCSSCGLFQRR